MTTYKSVEDALAHADSAESLSLSCKGVDAIPESIVELAKLRSLRLDDVHSDLAIPTAIQQMESLEKLDISGADDGSVPFPTVLLDTGVTDLEIRHFRVREVFALADQLKRFRLASYTIFDDMEPLFTHFGGLEYLEIWGYHGRNAAGNKQALVFGPQIANLTALTELEVVSAGMNALPAELGELEKLHTIRLRNHEFVRFPAALTTLPNLRLLEFGHMSSLSSFGPEVADMTALRELQLRGSWNGGALPSSWEEKTYEPLPSVLGELTGLEVLNLDQCAVSSLDVIEKLTNLKELSLAWAPLTDLGPLTALRNLEKIALENAWVTDIKPLAKLPELREVNIASTKVTSLKPLAKSQKLEVLNIRSAKCDRRNPLKALESLVDLPVLETVISGELEEGAWAKLRGAEIVDGDGLAERLGFDDFATVMGALNEIIEYSKERSTHDHNALIDLFGLDVQDYDTTPIEFAPLDDALARWGQEINPVDLGRLVQATFVNTSDGWTVTLAAIQLLIDSKSVEGQMGVVEAWSRATAYYDGGHREWGLGVHDRMIDDFWPEFCPEVLAAFLPTLDGDQLDSEYGDGLDALFIPAFAKLSEPDDELLECLREYALDRADDPDIVLEIIADCISEASGAVKSALQEIEQAVRDGEESEAEEVEVEDEDSGDSEEAAVAPSISMELLTAAFNSDVLGERLEAADGAEVDGRLRTAAAAFTNNKLIEHLKASRDDDGLRLMRAYEDFVRRTDLPDARMRNELATNTLVLAVRSKDEGLERFFEDVLLPDHITHATLAFNLACYWAQRGDKQKLVETTRLARELGKPVESFQNDTDFDAYRDDPEFLEAAGLEAPAKPTMRRFVYQDEKSHKFWAVAVDGSSLHLNWGRVGTDGQSKTKEFADEAAAQKDRDKLIRQKTGKGYEES